MAAPTRPGPPAPQKAPAAKQAAPKEPPPEADAPKAPKASRRGSLLPAIIVAVALLVAAFLLKGGGGGGSDTPASATPTVSTAEAAASESGDPAEVVALDAITLNLADGRFLKLGLALQLAPGTEVSDAESFGARALDQTIDLLGAYTYKDLSVKGARAKAKEKLSKAVSEAYDGTVLSVYFTEFVMQ